MLPMMKTFLFPAVLAGVLLSGCSSRVDDYEALLKEACEPQAEIEHLKADFAKLSKEDQQKKLDELQIELAKAEAAIEKAKETRSASGKR